MGGGWTAYGEGLITPARRGEFGGATATFLWSCLGVQYRYASDGVGRIVFSQDGSRVRALYMAFEAPSVWLGAEGVRCARADAPPPQRDTLRGPTDARAQAPRPCGGSGAQAARAGP